MEFVFPCQKGLSLGNGIGYGPSVYKSSEKVGRFPGIFALEDEISDFLLSRLDFHVSLLSVKRVKMRAI
jgi:hypothetical protein